MDEKIVPNDTIMVALAKAGLLPKYCSKVTIVDDVNGEAPCLLITFKCLLTEEYWAAIKNGPTPEEYTKEKYGKNT